MKKKEAEHILKGITDQGFDSFISTSTENLDEIKDRKFRNLRMDYNRAHNDLLLYLLESAKQPMDESKLIKVPTPEDDLIKSFKPVFDEFPILNYLPLFVAGRINDGMESHGESYSFSIEDYLDCDGTGEENFLFIDLFNRSYEDSYDKEEYKKIYTNLINQDSDNLSIRLKELVLSSDLDDLMDNKFFDWMRDDLTSFVAFIKRNPETGELTIDSLEVDG